MWYVFIPGIDSIFEVQNFDVGFGGGFCVPYDFVSEVPFI